jgi:hypothetical protein
LKDSSLRAKDAEIGSVEDLYFDDEGWAIRYVVVDTGKWLPGRKVLISPVSVTTVDWDAKAITVSLDKIQVENSPDIATHKPISRQHELEFYDYYGYPYYWPGPYMWGPVPYPGLLGGPSQPSSQDKELRAIEEKQRSQDQHLRSAREVINYYIEASDGEIGHVEDFLLDDESWAIRYLVVDTKNWWPGKKVIVSPQWIRSVSWPDSKVYVDLPRQSIKGAPEYNEKEGLTRDYESRIYRHYGRAPYWDGEAELRKRYG